MAIRLTISELVRVFAHRKGIRLYEVGKIMGYEKTNFYSKLSMNRWRLEDLEKIKEMFDVRLDDVLESISNNTYK